MSSTLFVSDLDGTLLTSAGRITERTRAAVLAVRQGGHTFAIATSRPVRDVRQVALALDCSPIAICGNGSITYDFSAEHVVDYAAIPADEATTAVLALRATIPGVRFGAERYLEFLLEDAFALTADLRSPARITRALEDELDGRGIGKLIVQAPGDAAEYHALVRSVLPRGFETTYSTTMFCEVTRSGVDKASALARLSASLGVAREATVAFGDNHNDLPMLRWAAVAVAVGNGHPDVLAAAHHITATNDRDGVARWLEVELNRLASAG